MQWGIGVDLGGTKTEFAAVSIEGRIIERIIKSTDAQGGPSAIEKQILSGIEELVRKMNTDPVGIGVGVAGQVDSNLGLVHFAPNLPGWQNIPLKDQLAQKWPVYILNDVRAATWGEWKHGAARGCQDFVCIFLGTGIGGGIVSGGKLLQGFTNSAGEIGHMPIDLYGPSCTCGNRGCFEALAGGWAIARCAREAAFSSPEAAKPLLKMVHGDEEAMTAKIVIEAAKQGDALAQELIDKAFEAIIAASVGIINAFNPERLIFGGGLSLGLGVVDEVVDTAIRGRALKVATSAVKVSMAELGNEAGVIGAATFAMQEKKK